MRCLYSETDLTEAAIVTDDLIPCGHAKILCNKIKREAGQLSAADSKEAAFTIAPYILEKNGNFYLVYQVDTKEGTNGRWVIRERNTKDKLYFFFAGKTSFPEYHRVVLRPVTKNEKNIARCKADAVFWLNPDGSEMKLKIVDQ